MKIKTIKHVVLSATALSLLTLGTAQADGHSKAKPVGITKGVMEVAGISRNQNGKATINKAFTKTSRPCPPFCIQPTHPFAPAAVDTISELDIINAAEAVASGDKTVLLMDNRTPVWTSAAKGGTIPHAVNIPFNKINAAAFAKDPFAALEIITKNFNVKEMDGALDFSNAKTLYMFCNGAWCGQSPAGIKALLKIGYPQHKLKYYRGGMNAWHSFGLTTVAK